MEMKGKHSLDARLNESRCEVGVRSGADCYICDSAHTGVSLHCLKTCGATKPIVAHLTCKSQWTRRQKHSAKIIVAANCRKFAAF